MSVLENNSAKMADILAAVNALPDAGSGGGSVPESGVFTYTESIYEPGVNEYVLTSENLKSTERYLIVFIVRLGESSMCFLVMNRESLEADFTIAAINCGVFGISTTDIRITDSTLTVYGGPTDTSTVNRFEFIAV